MEEKTLTTIRDPFDMRVAELFASQKDNSFDQIRPSGWNAPQRYAYPRIEYATANLWYDHCRFVETGNGRTVNMTMAETLRSISKRGTTT